MALITCPDCGKEISEQARACPYCGAPVTGPGGFRRPWRLGCTGLIGLILVLGFLATRFDSCSGPGIAEQDRAIADLLAGRIRQSGEYCREVGSFSQTGSDERGAIMSVECFGGHRYRVILGDHDIVEPLD